jgi:hypothetical protein
LILIKRGFYKTRENKTRGAVKAAAPAGDAVTAAPKAKKLAAPKAKRAAPAKKATAAKSTKAKK